MAEKIVTEYDRYGIPTELVDLGKVWKGGPRRCMTGRHALVGKNLVSGRRECRACRNERKRERRAERHRIGLP